MTKFTTTIEEVEAGEADEAYELHYNNSEDDRAIVEMFTFYTQEDRIFYGYKGFDSSADLVKEVNFELDESLHDVAVREEDQTPLNFVREWRDEADFEILLNQFSD